MKKEQTIRRYLENYDKGLYKNPDFNTQCDAGWYDWFCEERELCNKTIKLTNFLKQIVFSKKINIDTMYVFFKNNCPCDGNLYDDFRICDIEKDGEVVYTITPASGFNNNKGMSEVWGRENKFEGPIIEGSWSDVLKFFEVTPPVRKPTDDWLDEKRESCVAKPKLVLVGEDGNAFYILGKAMRVAKKNGLDWEKIKTEATLGDYDHLLQTMMKYFDVE
jgi:hypothetical protein